MKQTHICPPFCHRCPELLNAIRAYCTPNQLRRAQNQNRPETECGECACSMRCAVCESPDAEARCVWPVEIFIASLVKTIQPGDVVSNGYRVGRVLMIVDTSERSHVSWGFNYDVRVQRLCQKPGGALVMAARSPDDYRWDGNGFIRRLTMVPCGDPCRFRHVRDLGGDGKYVCAAHWSTQLEAIA